MPGPHGLTRRGLLLGPLALASAVALPAGAARAQGATPLRMSGIQVDLTALQRYGTGAGTLAGIQQSLGAQMHKVFGDLLGGRKGAPILVARISHLSLTAYAGGYAVDSIGPNDSIEGDGVLVQGGREISSTHVLTDLSPAYSGAYYTPGIDRVRMDSITYQFAYWLRREMNV